MKPTGEKLASVIIALFAVLTGWSQQRTDMIVEEVIISYEVNRVEGINSATHAEFSPMIPQEGQLVYVSSREYDYVNYGENRWKEDGYLNIYAVDYSTASEDSIIFDQPHLLSNRFTSESHSGPISFTADGKTAILTQVRLSKSGGEKHRPQLYISSRVDGKWTQPEPLPFNNPEYSFGHPSISSAGDVLFFSSNMPGGKGGNDLYKVIRGQDGNFSKPVNLGDSINTSGDEVFPTFIDSALYFSSTGHGSLGGLDLFKAEETGDNWTVVSLGETFNSSRDDFGICFDRTARAGFFSSDRANGSDDLFRWKLVESRVVRSRILAGKFEYRHLSGENPGGMEVMLLDDSGEIQYTTLTDKDGEFKFENLPLDENYVIKVDGEDTRLELTIYNKDGEKVAFLLSNDDGTFVYKKLNPEEVGTLALMDQTDVDITTNTFDFSGQFVYDQLPQEFPDGMKVLLVDDEGNVVYETKTDGFGNFNFSKLPIDENYILKVEQVDKDMTLLIYNDMDNVTAVLRMNDGGEFVYRKLSGDYSNNLAMLDMEDSDILDDVTMSLMGQFRYKNMEGDFGDGLSFMVVDDEGNVVREYVTDKEGFFRLQNLPLTESYVFKLDSDDPDFNEQIELVILNRKGKRVAMLDKDKHGYFVYSPLGLGGPINLEKINMEEPELGVEFKVPYIYYDTDSYRLSSEARRKLKEVIETLKENEMLQVEVNSYADSRASEDYNLRLSRKRTDEVIEYLERKGIPSSRISGNAYGESKILNDCEDNVDCPDELHRLNRRTEFRIY